MEIVFIHGANASNVSWNWAGSQIKNHTRLPWGMMTDPDDNLTDMELALPERCIVVGHSMGGLYAWHLANRNPGKVVAGISIATPWGGSMQASLWKMVNVNIPWLRMISRMEPWTAETRLLEAPVPWTNVVCTHGFDLFGVGPNDGVVTVQSQRELFGPAKEITLDYGHNTVLQSTELVDIVQTVSRRSSRQTVAVS
jgi:pimeloyl-ACP methyl ester carboxylesterase